MNRHPLSFRAVSFKITFLFLFIHAFGAIAADWPAYRHDNYRSGKTPEKLDARRLTLAWKIQSPTPPQPAWAGPAKWDAYRNLKGLRSMRNYDPVFHPIVVGDSLYYGSSVDDAVHCIDTKTGKRRWAFFTDGPVRIAPMHVDGKLYFGSDDGAAYCFDAKNGKEIWKFRPAKRGRLILNNGRFIPLWPVRTGVLVDNGVAYFAAGMLPWHPTFLCAVSATTGKVEGPGHFVKELSGVTIEGPMLCSLTKLIAPQGRVAPLLFDRKTGKRTGQLSGGGGVFVMVTKDDHILHGPGNKTGWITDSNIKNGAKLASLPGANAMIVHGETAYILTNSVIVAMDRSNRKQIWSANVEFPYELILANDTIYAGGMDAVGAFDAKTGKQLATLPVRGRAYGLVAANGKLVVSTDEGEISCFHEGEKVRTPEAVKKTDERLPPLPKVAAVKDNDLIGRWVFHRDLFQNGRFQDLNGKLSAALAGRPNFRRLGSVDVLELEGSRTFLQLAANHATANLPKQVLTATAWVRVDEPKTWGGIIGAIQDNGSYERGWLLGYNGSHFCMAVNGKSGPNRLLYLKAKTPFVNGRWYHVAGVYDGKTLEIFVNGKLENRSNEQAGDINYPPQANYVIGVYKDKDEFFPLRGGLHEVRLYKRALSGDEIAAEFQSKQQLFPDVKAAPQVANVAVGPFLQFTGRHTAVVRYKTSEPAPTTLELSLDNKLVKRYHNPAKTKSHEVVLTDLRHKRQYQYVIHSLTGGKGGVSRPYECDTFFNYSLTVLDNLNTVFGKDEQYAEAAKQILRANEKQGICLVIGSENGRLAYEIAKRSKFRIVGVDTDAKRVEATRRKLLAAGCYGSRITIHHVKSYDKLPFTGGFSNLVVSDSLLKTRRVPVGHREVMRVLRPGSAVKFGFQPAKGNKKQIADLNKWVTASNRKVLHIRSGSWIWVGLLRPKLTDSGTWSHLYGDPDNSAFGGETLGGAKSSGDLQVQWVGRPGPRANPDRNGRRPSPLSTGGRLFVQGLERLIALDAYNGSVLWSLEIPPMRRFNMPRDCGNWCADEKHVFAAVGGYCWKIDAESGRIIDFHSAVPAPRKDWQWDWGYIARTGDHLIGSAVKKGTSHTNFFGGSGAGWYDARAGAVTQQVCSDNLFSLNADNGSRRWRYFDGAILNSTITIGNKRIYFVESRHPKVKSLGTRRIGIPELWQQQFMVALDVNTGKKIWEKSLKTVPGSVVFYLSYQDEKLVLVSSQRQYHAYAYSAKDGTHLWKTDFGWQASHHGGHMSRPAIVGGKVYVRPRVLDLKTGKLLPETMPGGGCGTYACTQNALIFRAGNVTMWDREKRTATRWTRLRPDCWISTIPAQGMLLSPEGGGGCSCGSWLETSIGFRPKEEKR